MKGVNRHTIWPESGRSTSKRISIMDVNLIKDMNMNAVRFHYPPDNHFLQACDSLGLFVLDELAGWQNPYDTSTGKKLIKEMVQRDVNHPSVIIWDQGNEGGWNEELDTVFLNMILKTESLFIPGLTLTVGTHTTTLLILPEYIGLAMVRMFSFLPNSCMVLMTMAMVPDLPIFGNVILKARCLPVDFFGFLMMRQLDAQIGMAIKSMILKALSHPMEYWDHTVKKKAASIP